MWRPCGIAGAAYAGGRRGTGRRRTLGDVFLYTGTEDTAREADRVVREMLARHQLSVEFTLDRWHPLEEDWDDASALAEAIGQEIPAKASVHSLAVPFVQFDASKPGI